MSKKQSMPSSRANGFEREKLDQPDVWQQKAVEGGRRGSQGTDERMDADKLLE